MDILIVDDQASIRTTIAAILEDAGYTYATAVNGEDALGYLSRELPRLVLLDMQMPVLDGWGFAAALRDRGLTLPLVVMTAALNARRWGDEVGAAATLPKPFDIGDLLAVVERFCGAPPSGSEGGSPHASTTPATESVPPAGRG